MTVSYRSRQDWGGGSVAAGHLVDGSSFVRLAEHHTVIVMPDYDHDGMTAGDVDDFDRYMRALKVARPDLGPDVPYSYCIAEGATESDCIVGEGRGNRHTGAHTIGFNSSALGCAWAGDFTHKSPTPGMYEGLRWVGRTMLRDPVNALPTIQHRDVYATQCPGLSTPSPSLAQPPFVSLVPPVDLKEYPMRFIAQFPDTSGYLVDTQSGFFLPLTAAGAQALIATGVPLVAVAAEVGDILPLMCQELRQH